MIYDTILFDFDDTLLDRKRSICTFIRLFQAEYEHMLECDSLKFKDIFTELDSGGYTPRKEMFIELLDRTEWSEKPENAELTEYWYREFPLCAEPMPGLYSILDYLLNRKIKMGIVTNSRVDFQNRKIDKLNVRKYMSTIIISEEVGLSKPNPDIFYLAMSKTCSKPETTLFVGDYPSTDIKGACAAGLASVWLSSGKTWTAEEYRPTYIINDLSDLIKTVCI